MDRLRLAPDERVNFCAFIAIQEAAQPRGNARDDFSTANAARHYTAGKPAFGWTASYANAPAGTFAAEVNELASIEAAQDSLRAHFSRNDRDVDAEEWLDGLLPLNRAAVLDLLAAYQRVGSFRSADELEARTAKFAPARRVAA